ncbi:hypothetical protein BH10ACI1_BH10ACI1_29420 [soil metagenome]
MWQLFDYQSKKGNEIKKWTLGLQKLQRIKLNAKLDMLQQSGSDLTPQLLAGTGVPHIFKLRVQGNPKLRPLLCKGTANNKTEFTLLIGAFEIQWEFDPKDALAIAVKRREDLLNDPSRRCKHERIK